MLLAFLLIFIKSNRRICICNDKCTLPSQSERCFEDYSQTKFEDYFKSQLSNVSDVEIDIYSTEKLFLFKFDTNLFRDKEIIFYNFPDSQSVVIEYKYKESTNKKITLDPDYKLTFPSLLPYNPKMMKVQNDIHIRAQPTPYAVPISIPIFQMKWTGSLNCDQDPPAGMQTYIDYEFGCTLDSNNQPTDPTCGISCGTNDYFEYTFKGVQFAIYGTLSYQLIGFNIHVDGNWVEYIDVRKSTQKHALLFTSTEMEYGDHTVKISYLQGKFEIYKLVFWPDFLAQRLNITDFYRKYADDWVVKSDGVGGIRTYDLDYDGHDVFVHHTFRFKKFWIYGSKYNYDDYYYLSFNEDYTHFITIYANENLGSDSLVKQSALVYESGDYPLESRIFTFFNAEQLFDVKCVFYIGDPPTQSFTPSKQFTPSSKFTPSNPFTKSKVFKSTSYFTKSAQFSSTDKFSKTAQFTKTGEFSKTYEFSKSEGFASTFYFTGSKQFSKSNQFSDSKSFTETDYFTKTDLFSISSYFTKSNKFSKSNPFLSTKQFSKSNLFSESTHFTETDHFTKTGLFSISTNFTNSIEFSKSNQFSDSGQFSKSGQFSESKYFTETGYFTKTDLFSISTHFSNSAEFSKSNQFSNTKQFSKSNQFSNTKQFSNTNQFSNSDKFSSSFYFSNSEHFTKSYEFTPSATFSDDPTRYSCLVSNIDENKTFILYDRCYFTGLSNKYDVSLIRTRFENFVNETDGGAIYILDTTISFNNSEFIECSSIKGSGGAIYINNSINIKNDITFDNLTFTNCQATFGGAIMIYSISELSNVSIKYCHFYSNKLTGTNMDEDKDKDKEFKGGSAAFLCARNINVQESQFVDNKGRSGALKIYNNFKEATTKNILENTQNSIVISECEFEKNDKSKSSIYYINGKYGSKLDIINCNFKDQHKENNKYIDGKEINPNSPKLTIKSCHFEQYTNHTQQYHNNKTSFLIILPTMFVLFIVISLLIKKVNKSKHEI